MLSENSILRRLPLGIDQKQMVFLDGIRHAAEIVGLAYSRLEAVLTHLVSTRDELVHVYGEAYVAAFMDAWALVDSVDRFRMLWKMLPGFPFSPEGDVRQKDFETITQPIRNLRNVTDHLAQRAEYVAASGNPVLGLLTWVTYPDGDIARGFTCLLAPGTRGRTGWKLVNPATGGYFSTPLRTGSIHLAAGEFQADLSAVIPEITSRVHDLELLIEHSLREMGQEGKQAGGDHFIALAFNAESGQAPEFDSDG